MTELYPRILEQKLNKIRCFKKNSRLTYQSNFPAAQRHFASSPSD